MQKAGHDRAQFERELMRQGIGVVFRTNDAGRIYGATFIDHAAKAVFNGSRLGKEFSAGVFNDLFAGQHISDRCKYRLQWHIHFSAPNCIQCRQRHY